MATYTYETIPVKEGGEPRRFEINQSMKEAPLERHPDTGEPIRRVITGGTGFISGGRMESSSPPVPRGGGCGSGACGCH